MKNLIQQIESELSKKDCNPGELKDATKASYPEIFAVIKHLSDEGKVSHHFINSTLTYHLNFWKV
ncbi:hypothetical protein GS682_04570 [Nostoc sp. B(2019)]|nr:hypothetical protein [Nostoc sp. B(2019)]